LERAVELWRGIGDAGGLALALENLGQAERMHGRAAVARALHAESLLLYRRLRDTRGESLARHNLASAAHLSGDLPVARAHAEEAVAALRALGDRFELIRALRRLGAIAHQQGDAPAARAALIEALQVLRETGHPAALARCLDDAAGFLATGGQPQRAALLLAAAEAQRRASGTPVLPSERGGAQRVLERVRGRMDPSRARELAAEGSTMTVIEAADYAIAALASVPASTPPAAAGPALSAREWEVAAAVARGLTNREIADDLVISPRTVERHVDNIRAKLGVRSRTQIALWAEQRERPPAAGRRA
jgi:ATP/maltotriose-dependent transcriptional regulator MalT